MAEVPLKFPASFKELWTPSRYKAFHGGRGGAKSHSMAGALILMGAERRMRIGCYREIQRSISASVIQLLKDKVLEAGLGQIDNAWDKPQSGFYKFTDRSIRGGNGTDFQFAGLRTNPENVKSTEGLDVAWVEEARSVSRASLRLLTPTVRKAGSELWFSWNRKSTDDPVDDMFLGGEPPPRSIVRKVGWRDNPWFPDELREEMEWDRSRDYDKYLHVWEGEPVIRSDARVFNNWRIDDIDLAVPQDCRPRYGADWGFSVDPTVAVECYIWGRTLYLRREVYRIRCEIDDTPALFAGDCPHPPGHAMHWRNPHGHEGIPGIYNRQIVADSARPETISYMQKRGFRIRRAIKGANSVEEGVEFMRSCDIVVHPDCRRVADELATYSYKVDDLTEEILPELKDRDNHFIDAARYALEGVRRAGTKGAAGLGPESGTAGPRVVE